MTTKNPLKILKNPSTYVMILKSIFGEKSGGKMRFLLKLKQ
jgi:hypothetical protein